MDDASIAVISRAEAKAQGLKRFFTGEPCMHGHVAERSVQHGGCIECSRIRRDFLRETDPEMLREATKKWKKENPERVRDVSASYYQKNKEKRNQQAKDWRKKNPELKKARDAAWNAANHEKIKAMRRRREKHRRAVDPMYLLLKRMQSSINKRLADGGYTKRSRTHEYLGCSFDEFKLHIEKQFLKGMTWENRSLWHLDHLRPVSSAKTEEELIAIHHFTNLRPLWAKDNLAKGDNMEFLI